MKMLKLQEMFPDEENFSFLQNKYEKQPSRGFLREKCLKICSKFTGEHPCQSVRTPLDDCF